MGPRVTWSPRALGTPVEAPPLACLVYSKVGCSGLGPPSGAEREAAVIKSQDPRAGLPQGRAAAVGWPRADTLGASREASAWNPRDDPQGWHTD